MVEVWKESILPGTEGLIVSNHGRVGYPNGRLTLGSLTRHGYRRIGYKNKHYQVHRIVCYAFHYKFEIDKRLVDHIDRNKQNNHASNLRFYTHQLNGYNSDKPKGYYKRKPWQAQIRVKDKKRTKSFDTEKEARLWYLLMKGAVVANGGNFPAP